MSEELDDFVKECRAAAVDKKASDLTSLFLVNGQPDRGSTKISGSRARDGPSKRVFVTRIVSSIDMGFRSFPPTRLCLPFES